MNLPFRESNLYAFRPCEMPASTRRALGSFDRRVSQPTTCCAYCWPRLIAAAFYDNEGHGCCMDCGSNADRIARLPTVRA